MGNTTDCLRVRPGIACLFTGARRVPQQPDFMWKGRFKTDTAQLLKNYSESISFDWRLYRHDIAGSIAHAARAAGGRA